MQTKDQNTTSNPLSTLSLIGQVLHKAIYLGLFTLKQLMDIRLLNSELKKIVEGFLRSSPVAIEKLYDFLYAEFLYSYHLSYYRKDEFVLFQQFCESLNVKEAWRTSQNTTTRLLVGMLEDTDITIDRPQSGMEVMLDGAQERRTAQFPKGKQVFADDAQLLFDEMILSISHPKKMFILVATCNFLGVKKEDLIALDGHQKVLFEMLTTITSPTFFKPYYTNPTELLSSVCAALPEEKYGDLMAHALFSALLSLTQGKTKMKWELSHLMKWDLGPLYFNLCGINFSKNDFSDSILTGANFFNSDLRGAVFHDKDLSSSSDSNKGKELASP